MRRGTAEVELVRRVSTLAESGVLVREGVVMVDRLSRSRMILLGEVSKTRRSYAGCCCAGR